MASIKFDISLGIVGKRGVGFRLDRLYGIPLELQYVYLENFC